VTHSESPFRIRKAFAPEASNCWAHVSAVEV
jgi:hypothetical protein